MIAVFIRHRAMLITIVALGLFFGRNHPLTAAPGSLTLGSANGFNQYILEDVTLTDSRAGGRAAYGGTATLTNHQIGDDATCIPALNIAIFGDDLDYMGGQINAGSAVYAGTIISDTFNLTCPGATFTMDDPVDFAAAAIELATLSSDYASQPANGITNLGASCFVELRGTSTGENVFAFDGSALTNNSTSTCNLFVNVPCGATALINISGETINLAYLDVVIIGGITRGQVLFNLHEATTVTMTNGSDFEGSVLAPLADFNVQGESFIEGTLVAKSLSGDTFNSNDFPLLPAQSTCFDFGDLPDAFGIVTEAQNGARHEITDLYLGIGVDGEADGQQSALANDDDTTGVADEDGIVATPSEWTVTDGGEVMVTASADGCLTGWIDWDDDKTFADADELIINNVAVMAGINTLSFDVPTGGNVDQKFGRFRLYPATIDDGCVAVSPIGLITGGEVEDYRFIFADPSAISLLTTNAGTISAVTLTFVTLLLLAGITVRSTYNRP